MLIGYLCILRKDIELINPNTFHKTVRAMFLAVNIFLLRKDNYD